MTPTNSSIGTQALDAYSKSFSAFASWYANHYLSELSTTSICKHRTYVAKLNAKMISIHATPGKNKHVRKQLASKLAYLTKQRDAYLNLYPEYFI